MARFDWSICLPGFLVNKFIFNMYKAAVKMQGTVYIFQICAVEVAFNCFPGNGEGK